MKPFAPPPPPGAQPPPLWGREDHVRALLGDRVTSITARWQALRVEAFPTPEAFQLAGLARRHAHGSAATVMHWEYLLLTACNQG